MALRKFLILRRPRSGRREGRAMLIQHLSGFPHSLESGNPGQLQRRLPWTPAFAGVTVQEKCENNRHSILSYRLCPLPCPACGPKPFGGRRAALRGRVDLGRGTRSDLPERRGEEFRRGAPQGNLGY